MSLPEWKDLIAGNDCPLCALRPDVNEFSFKIADLGCSTLYLERDQTYRGYCVLIFKARHVTGIEKLTANEYDAFMKDLRRSADAIFKTVAPDHMNYATLGNVIPHLHFHIIPRYADDERWGAPVWVTRLADMTRKTLPEDEYHLLAAEIRQKLV